MRSCVVLPHELHAASFLSLLNELAFATRTNLLFGICFV